jgi:hypothetical protein
LAPFTAAIFLRRLKDPGRMSFVVPGLMIGLGLTLHVLFIVLAWIPTDVAIPNSDATLGVEAPLSITSTF